MIKVIPMQTIIRHGVWLGIALISWQLMACAPGVPGEPGANRPQVKACIHLHNDSKQELAVGFDGPESRFINVSPRSKVVVYLEPGVYQYAVAARGAEAVSGNKFFASNHNYRLKFGVSQFTGRAD